MNRAEVIERLKAGEVLVLAYQPDCPPDYRLGAERITSGQWKYLHDARLVNEIKREIHYAYRRKCENDNPSLKPSPGE